MGNHLINDIDSHLIDSFHKSHYYRAHEFSLTHACITMADPAPARVFIIAIGHWSACAGVASRISMAID
jgi:hypothetical protein